MAFFFVILSLFSFPATTRASTPLTLSLHSRLSLPPASVAIFPDYQSTALLDQLVSGLTLGNGEYFARMGIGRPVQTYYWVVDTGSDVTWMQCTPCEKCFPQAGPIFNPLQSSTYYYLPCGTTCDLFEVERKACDDGDCLYEVKYKDGLGTFGHVGSETLTFENSKTFDDIVIGCSHYTRASLSGPTGVIGLGRGPLSLPSQIDATSFSYCLVERTSTNTSTLEFNIAAPAESVTAPLVRNTHFPSLWFIELEGISVGGQILDLPPYTFSVDPKTGRGGTIVDSGTAITRLPTRAYNVLKDEFVRVAANLERADPLDYYDTCFSYSVDGYGAMNVPTVAFVSPGNQILNLPLEGVLVTVGQTACLAFTASSSNQVVIGNVQQQRMRVHFGIAESVISFVPNSC